MSWMNTLIESQQKPKYKQTKKQRSIPKNLDLQIKLKIE